MRRKITPGDVAAQSGTGTTVNLDRGSRDSITWLRNTLKRSDLATDANSSVLVRRAIDAYVRHIEALLFSGPPKRDALTIERICIASAARGDQDELPEEELIAVPPQSYSRIRATAYEARRELGRQRIQNLLKGPPAGRVPFDDSGNPVTEP
jgi:hypothetical protein